MRLRDITPKSLFGRMLAIILVPIILVQIISVSIFYERHWDWVSRHMAKNLSKDLGLLIDELGKEPSKDQRALSALQTGRNVVSVHVHNKGGGQFFDLCLEAKSAQVAPVEIAKLI